jgi:DNA-binding NtrC family response regulator
MSDLTRTRSLPVDDGLRHRPRCAYLHLVVEAARPRAGGARHALVDVDEVSLGRGDARSCKRADRRLALRIPDESMSTRHALVRLERMQWVISDEGSKNGVRINGVSQSRAILRDGDIIELGRTVFSFRASAPQVGDRRDVARSGPDASGVSTLVPELEDAFAELIRIAPTSTAVLVRGATGTGKELVARTVHTQSRRPGSFVPVNCGALPAALLESELFGYRRGAFSGAGEDRAGLVAASDGGTLFLDEIGDLPAASQAALLRVLAEGEVRPVGATAPIHVDLRVVAATHRELETMVDDGEFREDLYARLNGFTLSLPALAERREDLGLLLSALLDRIAATEHDVSFTAEAARALVTHAWPRNVRELVKCLERAVPLAGAGPIGLAHLPLEVTQARPAAAQPEAEPEPEAELSEAELARKTELIALLAAHGGNISEVARVLGRVRPQIQRWIKRYGIDASSFRR